MNAYYKENMLIQTFIELDTQISNLTQRIAANRYIEIGDDPRLIRDIENILLWVHNRVKSIEPYFDLKITTMRKANVYFALIMHVNDTLKYLQDVRKKDYGSRQHTRELLEKLENCANSIYAIGDLVNTNTETVH